MCHYGVPVLSMSESFFFFFFKQIELNVDEMMAYERLDCSDRPFKIHFPL